MDQGIKFVITATTKGLEDGTKKAKKEIKELEKSVEQTDKKAKKGAKALDDVGESAEEMAKKASTGAKSLTASLLGSGGVLAAFTAVVGIMSIMEQNGITLGDALSWLSGRSTDAARAQREFNEAISNGVGDARGEIAVVSSLVSVLQDETSTREEQLRAYNKINELQPSVLDGISLEESATADLTKNIDALSESLIRQAKIKGAQDLIAKETAKILKLQSKSAIDAANGWDWLAAAYSGAGASTRLVTGGLQNIAEDSNDAQKNIARLTEQIRNLIAEDIEVGGIFSTTKDPKSDSAIEKEAKRQAAIIKKVNAQLWKDEQDAAEQASRDMITAVAQIYQESGAAEIDLGIAEKIRAEAKATEEPILKLEKAIKKVTDQLKELNMTDVDISGLDASQLETLSSGLEDITIKAQLFGDAIKSSFGAMAADLSGALSTGISIVDAFTSSIINSLGQMAAAWLTNEITGKLIAQKLLLLEQAKSNGYAITIAAAAAAAAGPLGIALYPGFLTAISAQINGAFAAAQGIAAFAQGGIIGGGQFTGDNVLIRANSGERILTTQDQSMLTRFLRGESMATRNDVGGNMELAATTVIRGQDILLSWERASKSNRRYFK